MLHLFNRLLEVQLHAPNITREAFFLLHFVEELDGLGVRQSTFGFSDRQHHFKHIIRHFRITTNIVVAFGMGEQFPGSLGLLLH